MTSEARKSIHGIWAGKWTFILAAAGSAVGLGNIWKFPYMAGEYGGGAFVLVYLVCILLIGVPIMVAEILIGRRGRSSPANSMAYLAKDEKDAEEKNKMAYEYYKRFDNIDSSIGYGINILQTSQGYWNGIPAPNTKSTTVSPSITYLFSTKFGAVALNLQKPIFISGTFASNEGDIKQGSSVWQLSISFRFIPSTKS